jgi:hypothetical protein
MACTCPRLPKTRMLSLCLYSQDGFEVYSSLLRKMQSGWNSIKMLEKKFRRIFLLKSAKGQDVCLCRCWSCAWSSHIVICIGVHKHTVYRLTMCMSFDVEFSGKEMKVKVAKWEMWGQRFDSRKIFFCIFFGCYFLRSLIFLHCYVSRIYATYHSSN